MSTTARRSKVEAYAEDKLKINDVFAQSLEAEMQLATVLRRRSELEVAIRDVQETIEETSTNARFEFRKANPGLAVTAYDSQVRDHLARNDRLNELRKQKKMHQDELADVTAMISILERQHRSRVARMQVLAGYLNFLAATKNSANVARLVADII